MIIKENNDEYFMQKALLEAAKAFKINEIPIGAVIVKDNKIISKGYNKKEKNNSSLEHAEIIAIRKAQKKLKKWRLDDCKIYVTIEPCFMCTGAILEARIKEIIYGSSDLKKGFISSKLDVTKIDYFHKFNVKNGVLQKDCEKIIKDFFKELRKNKKKGKIKKVDI